MNGDVKIKKDILAELAWQPGIDETQIGVIVEDGVVALSGQVNEFRKKVLATDAAKRVSGVKAVAEDIEVKYGDDFKKTDKEIAKAVVNALEWNTSIPNGKVNVFVENGYIYLSGKLLWDYQKNAAKYALQNLIGVKGVVNNIEIETTSKPKNIEENIRKALERSAALNAQGIRVQVDGDTVELKGRVHSLEEREMAETLAYRAPGVREVRNEIVVQYHPEFT